MTRQVLVRTGSDLGLAVAEARAARGLTQVELARRVGVNRVYLAKLEAGLSVALVDRVLRILNRLGARMIIELPAPQDGATRAGD